MQTIRSSYDDELQDGGRDARAREHQALCRGIELLEGLGTDNNIASPQGCEALLYIRKLWTLFVEDLAHPDNGLPNKLRADLISIGLWIIKEADLIRHNKAEDVEPLIAVHVVMRDALK